MELYRKDSRPICRSIARRITATEASLAPAVDIAQALELRDDGPMDCCLNPDTDGQGFSIEVFPTRNKIMALH